MIPAAAASRVRCVATSTVGTVVWAEFDQRWGCMSRNQLPCGYATSTNTTCRLFSTRSPPIITSSSHPSQPTPPTPPPKSVTMREIHLDQSLTYPEVAARLIDSLRLPPPHYNPHMTHMLPNTVSPTVTPRTYITYLFKLVREDVRRRQIILRRYEAEQQQQQKQQPQDASTTIPNSSQPPAQLQHDQQISGLKQLGRRPPYLDDHHPAIIAAAGVATDRANSSHPLLPIANTLAIVHQAFDLFQQHSPTFAHVQHPFVRTYLDVCALLYDFQPLIQLYLVRMSKPELRHQLDLKHFVLLWEALSMNSLAARSTNEQTNKTLLTRKQRQHLAGYLFGVAPAFFEKVDTAYLERGLVERYGYESKPLADRVLQNMIYFVGFSVDYRPELKAAADWWLKQVNQSHAHQPPTQLPRATQETFHLLLAHASHLRDYPHVSELTLQYVNSMKFVPNEQLLLLPTGVMNSMLYSVLTYQPQAFISLAECLYAAQYGSSIKKRTLLVAPFGFNSESCELFIAYFNMYQKSHTDRASTQRAINLFQNIISTLGSPTTALSFELYAILHWTSDLQWPKAIELIQRFIRRYREIETSTAANAPPSTSSPSSSTLTSLQPDLNFWSLIIQLLDQMDQKGQPISVLTRTRKFFGPEDKLEAVLPACFTPLKDLLYASPSSLAPTSWVDLADQLHEFLLKPNENDSTPPFIHYHPIRKNVYFSIHDDPYHQCTDRYLTNVCYLSCRTLKRSMEILSTPIQEREPWNLILETDYPREIHPPTYPFETLISGAFIRPLPFDWRAKLQERSLLELGSNRPVVTSASVRVSSALQEVFLQMKWQPTQTAIIKQEKQMQATASNGEETAAANSNQKSDSSTQSSSVTPIDRVWTFDMQ